MRIRLTVHRPDLGKAPGDEVEMEAERALRLIESGQAEAVKVASERAVSPPSEVAVMDPPAKPAKKGR